MLTSLPSLQGTVDQAFPNSDNHGLVLVETVTRRRALNLTDVDRMASNRGSQYAWQARERAAAGLAVLHLRMRVYLMCVHGRADVRSHTWLLFIG